MQQPNISKDAKLPHSRCGVLSLRCSRIEWRLSRSETMTARPFRGGKTRGIKERRNNPSVKRFILVKTVLLAVTPGNLAGGCMCLFPRIYPREERSLGCRLEDVENWMFSATGVHSKISLVRSVSAKCMRGFSARYIRLHSRVTAFSKRITVDRTNTFRRLPPSKDKHLCFPTWIIFSDVINNDVNSFRSCSKCANSSSVCWIAFTTYNTKTLVTLKKRLFISPFRVSFGNEP